MSKKKKKPNALIKALRGAAPPRGLTYGAIAVFTVLYAVSILFYLSHFRAYFNICQEKYVTYQGSALSVASERNYGYRSGSAFSYIYTITLENGKNVSVYSRWVEQAGCEDTLLTSLSSERTYVYIPRPAYSNNSYPLISVSEASEEILPMDAVTGFYRKHILTLVFTLPAIVAFFLLLYVSMCIFYVCLTKRKKRNKGRKKTQDGRRNE